MSAAALCSAAICSAMLASPVPAGSKVVTGGVTSSIGKNVSCSIVPASPSTGLGSKIPKSCSTSI